MTPHTIPPIPPLCDWIRINGISGKVEVSTPRWSFPTKQIATERDPVPVLDGEGSFGSDGFEHEFAPLASVFPYVGEQWQEIEFLNPWCGPYILARIRMAFIDGARPDVSEQWEKWFAENISNA